MEWLEHDEVTEAALPEWARAESDTLDGDPYRVSVHSEGLVLRRGKSASAIRWDEVLVPIRLDAPRRLLVSAARRPPRTPWFELGGRNTAEIERAVRTRLEALDHRGYRQRRRARAQLPAEEILAQVLAKRSLPGAVEIPAASPSIARSAVVGGTVGGLTIGFYGLMVGPVGALIGGGIGLLGGAGVMGVMEALRKRAVGRVLVLTPDGFVGGLDGSSVRAVPWSRVGRFADGLDKDGRPALEVFSPDNQVVALVSARWFGAPLDVIVAVAEAYRVRTGEEMA